MEVSANRRSANSVFLRSGEADGGSAAIRRQCDARRYEGRRDSPGWRQEAIMSGGREHPHSSPGADRHRWFGAKVFVILAVTVVAAYVTARLL